MKKFLPQGPVLTLLAGCLAMSLRFWMLTVGVDGKGLYPRYSAPWLCLLGLSVLWIVGILFLSRETDGDPTYQRSFPASPLGAAGYLVAGLALAWTGICQWGPAANGLEKAVACLGMLSGAGFLIAAYQRLTGRQIFGAFHAIPCLYLALQVFYMGRVLGAEPEISTFLFPFLATVALLLACYQLWGFGSDDGNRRKSLFWSLTAAFLCLAAVPGSENWYLYLGCSLWLLTNTCSMAPEAILKEAEPSEDPSEELPGEALDADSIIDEVLQEMQEEA